jgi:hypothetical protein
MLDYDNYHNGKITLDARGNEKNSTDYRHLMNQLEDESRFSDKSNNS